MATGATGQLGLALPVQGELSGTWGNTVNNGITEYTNIAIAATLTLTGDGAVTLQNTTGDASASNITSSLTGAGTVTAQFAIVRVTGTLTTAKVVTAPSYSKTYTVVNAATGGIVTFKASGQTGVSIAVGESAFVYYNGTDYVKVSGTSAVSSFTAGTTGFTPSTATTGAVTLAGTLATTNGGTGLTSFTANGVVYASSSSALATGSALVFDGNNLGLGVTPSVWSSASRPALQLTNGAALFSRSGSTFLSQNFFYNNSDTGTYIANGFATVYNQASGQHQWFSAPSGTAGNAASLTQAMTLDASGNLGVGTTSPAAFSGFTTNRTVLQIRNSSSDSGQIVLGGTNALLVDYDNSTGNATIRNTYGATSASALVNLDSGTLVFRTGTSYTERARIDSAGCLSGVWADEVSALGNSGTATTITCTAANVFTATLTGNCTFTLSAPSTTTANTATSFTLILTNDATAGRTVAWAGGTFKFPGGSVTRTTTANATDIWFFFSPDGGTTWYGSIPMANLS